MKCKCNLFLDQCMWPGQCESLGHWIEHRDDIPIQDREHNVIENYGEYFEGLEELQTKNPWIMRPLDHYFERIVNPTIAKYERKETKMTKDEAIKKLENYKNRSGYYVLDCLEALGLIKFDEEKSVEQVINYIWYNSIGTIDFIAQLDKHGYKIVKK